MWSVSKYLIDSPDYQCAQVADPDEVAISLDDLVKPIKEYVQKHTDNYLIALHYLSFPIVISYGRKIPNNERFQILNDYFEPVKEIIKILMLDKAEYVSGFNFLRHNVETRKQILASSDQETFDLRAASSGLESYIIGDLRKMWCNSRLQYLSQALSIKYETLYMPDTTHPLYTAFTDYLRNVYRRGVDRFKAFICIGSTFIGKSFFFTRFVIPEKYYIYHSNYLEYSKMPDQPHKVFRILDDINWTDVTSTELKCLLNRNISSVNIKYGYEYIFPLIPVIIMNREDYLVFQKHFSDIWEFIDRNAVIYPPQGKNVTQEERSLFTNEVAQDDHPYLFDQILPVSQLETCTATNINQYIKEQLDQTQGYIYNTTKYLQLPEFDDTHIPNPEMSKKTILRQYEEYLLRKKVREIESENDATKPKLPWYTRTRKQLGHRFRAHKPSMSDDEDTEMDDEEKGAENDDSDTEMSDDTTSFDSGDDESLGKYKYGQTISL